LISFLASLKPENMRVANHIRPYICLEACAKFDIEFNESCIEIKLPEQVLASLLTQVYGGGEEEGREIVGGSKDRVMERYR
jgi:hypothetical protein